MTAEADASQIEIITIDNSAYECQLNPTYIVLGILNEYLGRKDMYGKNVVEFFYPSEKFVVSIFSYFLRKISDSHNISTDIAIETGPQGHFYIKAPALADYIRRLYGENYLPSFYDGVTFTHLEQPFETRTYGIAENMFPAFSRHWLHVPYEREKPAVDARLSYLLGAHLRFGKDHSFKMANAPHKIDLMIRFLEVLGVSRISKSWTVGGAPTIIELHFEPDDDLARVLKSGLAQIASIA